MNRLLLDTNIYGLLIVDPDFHKIHSLLEQQSLFRIYGFSVIRKELKQAPRVQVAGVNIQASLLRTYSSFMVKEYSHSEKMTAIAEEYYRIYSQLGGGLPQDKMFSDFLIVACASIKNIDLVVSEDNATMMSEISIKAYSTVNKEFNLKLPSFIKYKEFKDTVLGTGFPDPLINRSNKLWIFLCFLYILPFIFHLCEEETLIYKDFVLGYT